jgi:hypothetical protein
MPGYFPNGTYCFHKAVQAISVLHCSDFLNFRDLFVFGSHLSRFEIGRFSAIDDPSGVVHKATLVCAECCWTSFQIQLKEDVPAYLLKVNTLCPHFPSP